VSAFAAEAAVRTTCCSAISSSAHSITALPSARTLFAMPGNTVGSALALGGTSFPMPQEVALFCTTCNVRNEVSSHVSQLSIDAFHGDN
jgi:hypothetical protein